MSERTDKPLHVYWERFALWISGILIAVCAWMWVEQHGRIADLESKVQQLQIDKVSRQELTALEDRLYKAVKDWVATAWPFTSAAFPGRDIAWEAWRAIPMERR